MTTVQDVLDAIGPNRAGGLPASASVGRVGKLPVLSFCHPYITSRGHRCVWRSETLRLQYNAALLLCCAILAALRYGHVFYAPITHS
jgi:hypothetical protein